MGMTVVEKILAKAAGQHSVKALDVVEPRVNLAMSHENAALVINQFLEIFEGTGIEPLETRNIIVIEDGRYRVRERNVLRYYARSIAHLLSPPAATH